MLHETHEMEPKQKRIRPQNIARSVDLMHRVFFTLVFLGVFNKISVLGSSHDFLRTRKNVNRNTYLDAKHNDLFEVVATAQPDRNEADGLLDMFMDGFQADDGSLPLELQEAKAFGVHNTSYPVDRVLKVIETEYKRAGKDTTGFDKYGPEEGPFWSGNGDMSPATFQWQLEKLWQMWKADPPKKVKAMTDADLVVDPGKDTVEFHGLKIPHDEHEEAQDAIQRAREVANDEADLMAELTDVAIQIAGKGKVFAAWALFDTAAAIDPTSPREQVNLGVSLMRLGQREKAYDILKRELDNDPDSPRVRENFRENTKQLKQAIARERGRKAYRKSIELNRPLRSTPPVDFPRLTLDELYAPKNSHFLQGKKPFILTGVFEGEKLRELQRKSEAVLEYFGDKTHVDYIPFASHIRQGQPHALTSLRRGIKFIEHTKSMPINDSRLELNRTHWGQNMLWNPTWYEWYSIWNFLGLDNKLMPPLFRDDNHWLNSGACFPDMESRGNFEDATRWRLMALGGHLGGMYIHTDWLKVGSWQLQALGAKTWFICPRSENPFIGGDDDVDGHNPDLNKSAEFAVASCYNGTLYPGQFLYYPQGYWHQTLYQTQPDSSSTFHPPASEEWTMPWNLVPISYAISSTVIDPSSLTKFFEQLEEECNKGLDGEEDLNFRVHPKRARFCHQLNNRCKEWIKQGTVGKWWADTFRTEKERKRQLKDNPFYVTPEAEGEYCTERDTLRVREEIKKDLSAYNLIHGMVDDLRETLKLMEQEYGEDIRYGDKP